MSIPANTARPPSTAAPPVAKNLGTLGRQNGTKEPAPEIVASAASAGSIPEFPAGAQRVYENHGTQGSANSIAAHSPKGSGVGSSGPKSGAPAQSVEPVIASSVSTPEQSSDARSGDPFATHHDFDSGPTFVRILRLPYDPPAPVAYRFDGWRREFHDEPIKGAVKHETASVSASIDPLSDSGVRGDGLTNDNTPTLIGSGEPGATITAVIPSTNEHLSTTVAESGSWKMTPSIHVPDGVLLVSVTQTTGDRTSSATVSVTIDTVTTGTITVC